MQKGLMIVLVVLAGLSFVGCEWQTSSDGDSWNSSYDWVNFDGVYRPTAGRTYVISAFGPVDGGTEPSQVTVTERIGTSTGPTGPSTFHSILKHLPLENTVTVTAPGGNRTMTDDGQGNLSGNGDNGTVTYSTGAITVNYVGVAPAAGDIMATYNYYVEGSPGNQQPGSSKPVYSISVDQTGNKLSFRDSNGMTYSGEITSVSGGSDGTVSGAVVANFNVTGADGSKISGVLQGEYTPNSGDSGAGTLARVMNGTYTAPGGQTGDVVGSAGTVNVIVTPPSSGGTNAVPAP